MIQFKLNGKSINIPSCWEDVTFSQYIRMLTIKDDTIELISLFTGIEYATLKSAIIFGLDDILKAVSFINKPPQFPGSVSECGPYKIPVNSKGAFNIQHESLGQFEDMRSVMKQVKEGDIISHTKAYGKYVAIYLQKIRDGEYNPLAVPDMEAGVDNMPAYQVITLGGFFFLRLWSLSTGTASNSPSIPTNPKKSKPVLKSSKKSLDRSPRSRKRR